MVSTRASMPLARDGLLETLDHGYVGSLDQAKFTEVSPRAMARFDPVGIPVAVVTNQVGVARGRDAIEEVARMRMGHLAT